jgi:hypothetical protein
MIDRYAKEVKAMRGKAREHWVRDLRVRGRCVALRCSADVRLVPVPTGTSTEDGAFAGGEFKKVRARVSAVFVAAPPHKEHLQSS